MSFTTNRATRASTRSATIHAQNNSVSSLIPYPNAHHLSSGIYPRIHKKRKVASIGDDNAIGLVIHGSTAISPFEPQDDEGADPPLSGNTLQNPDFPISYTGRGTVKFVSPIRVAAIDGPLHVNGSIYSKGNEVATTAPLVSWADDIQVGKDGGGNLTKDVAATTATWQRTNDNITIHIDYSWTNTGGLITTDEIVIKGLPFVTAEQSHVTGLYSEDIQIVELHYVLQVESLPSEDILYVGYYLPSIGESFFITEDKLLPSGRLRLTMTYHGVV